MHFVVYGDRWGELPTSATHLFRHVAQLGHKVIWVNTIGRMPRFSLSDIRKAGRVMRDMVNPRRGAAQKDKVADQAQSISIRTAKMIPRFSPVPRSVNRRLLFKFHQRLVQEFQLKDEILVSPFPYVVDLFADAPARSLYFCYDEWSAYPGIDTRRWMEMEGQMLQTIDGFFATDQRLMEKCRDDSPSLYCPQGVEHEHFASPASPPPRELAKLPKPVIGFFGLISEWVDVELIVAAAKKFPQGSVLLIGRAIPAAAQRLRQISNVHMTGQIPYNELPIHAQVFDVGIIPFAISDLTRAVNPLKLLEYYALGCPVVSTGMQSVSEVGGPVLVGDAPDEFADAIGQWLSAPREEASQQARDHARKNSWTARAESLLEFVETIPAKGN